MADEAAGDATTAPRRSSRRELTSPAPAASTDDAATAAAAVRVDSGGDEASEPSSAATAPTTPDHQQSTRRSRRQVKSTYATHALASLSPVAVSSASSAPVAEENERITKRRRPNPSAAGTATATPVVAVSEAPQVLLVKVDPSFRPHAPHTAAAAETVKMTSVPALPASPTHSSTASPAPNSANRRRRPMSGADRSNPTSGIWSLTSALSAVTPMGDADVSARTQQRKVLGKYTGRECTLLCEVILQQLKRNSMDVKALERDHSPAFIRWEKVVQKLLKAHRLTISPLDAQTLWKFLAYAEQPPPVALKVTNSGKDGTSVDELLPASDSEDYAQSVQAINEKYKSSKNSKSTGATESLEAAEVPASHPVAAVETGVKDESSAAGGDERLATELAPQAAELAAAEVQTQATEQPSTDLARPQPQEATKEQIVVPGTHFRLYPVYGLPTGLPESWQQTKPFNLKETLPLTFVADKFLKKKAGAVQPLPAPVAAARAEPGAAVVTVVLPAATPTAAAAAPADSAIQAKPKTKRVRKAEPKAGASEFSSAEPAKKKPRAQSQKSPAGKAATTPALPRTPFVPSTTPPPQPLPPRAAFQFFCRMQEAESLAETFVAAASATAPPGAAGAVKKKTYFELQELFAGASLHVRNACQKLALEDLDRYNRECVRRRIWEKAMSNSPMTSPAPAATGSGSAQQAQQQQMGDIIPSLTVPVAITENPAPPHT